ncbi:MAG TPA: hypothetical protein VFV38_06900 [Ktedonobacteraceae bacterium]|nr:hypothetical protein [Ktedonobacteraceae bacterium]
MFNIASSAGVFQPGHPLKHLDDLLAPRPDDNAVPLTTLPPALGPSLRAF